LRGVDLNHRPLGYEPNELPDCSTPRSHNNTPQSGKSGMELTLGAREIQALLEYHITSYYDIYSIGQLGYYRAPSQ
jgi:hypothetical protein